MISWRLHIVVVACLMMIVVTTTRHMLSNVNVANDKSSNLVIKHSDKALWSSALQRDDLEILRFMFWIRTTAQHIDWNKLVVMPSRHQDSSKNQQLSTQKRQRRQATDEPGRKISPLRQSRRRRLLGTISTMATTSTPTVTTVQPNQVVFLPEYQYHRGNCPNAGSQGVPCAPRNLSRTCDKYHSGSRLRSCILACAPSYCCIHTAPKATNPFSPTCHNDENCAQYAPCYIAWWKISDRVGPAPYINLTQTDDFFGTQQLQQIITSSAFYEQVLFHHFNDITPILRLIGTSTSIQEVFANPSIWGSNSSIP